MAERKSNQNQRLPRKYPNLAGKVHPLVEQDIRYVYDLAHDAGDRISTLEDKSLITAVDAESHYGARHMRILLSASHPLTALNVDNLLGVLIQPQKALAPPVTVLPDVNDPLSQDGQLIWFTSQSLMYRFDGSGDPGTWIPILGVIQKAQTITANTTIADPTTSVPVGMEVEWQLTQNVVGGWVVTWASVFRGVSALTVGRTASRMNIIRFRKLTATQLVRIFSVGDVDLT